MLLQFNHARFSKILQQGALAVALLVTAAAAAGAQSFAFEAESAAQITKPFRVEADHLASGGKMVMQPLKSGRPPAVVCHALYKIKVTKPGRYHVWGRGWWPNGCANSVDVRLDNGSKATLGQDGTYTRWHWVELKGVTLNLTKGVHTFEMLNREDGPELDEFYFTTDSDDVPANIEKPTPGVIVK